MSQIYVLRGEVPSLKVAKVLKAEPTDTLISFVLTLFKKIPEPYNGGYIFYKLRRPGSYVDPLIADPQKTLAQNGFLSNDVVLIKKEPREVYVVCSELDKKQRFLVDLSDSAGEFFQLLIATFEVKKPEDFTLHRDSDELPLNPDKSLAEQQVAPGSTLQLKGKKLDVKEAMKNASTFISKSVQQGIIQGTEKLRKLKEHEFYRETIAKKPDAFVPPASKKLFGLPLEEGLKICNHPYEIPLIIEKCLQYVEKYHMKTEGIFRLSGAATILNGLREQFDRGEDPDLSQITDPHAVTGVLKAYLRELPEPPFPYELFPVLVSLLRAPPNNDARFRLYRVVIKVLPRINYLLLKRLFGFLSVLTKTAEFTKMHSQNLSTVFGPNLIKQKNESALEAVENTMLVSQLVDDLIRNYAVIFEFAGKDPKYTQLARALYTYAGQTESELSFEAGEIVFVTNSTASDGWWEGEFGGKFGLFPGNYLEVYMDLTKLELNDDASRIAAKMKDEIQNLQKGIKDDIRRRRELEANIQSLFEKFQDLTMQLGELEKENQRNQMRRKLGSFNQGSAEHGMPPPKPPKDH